VALANHFSSVTPKAGLFLLLLLLPLYCAALCSVGLMTWLLIMIEIKTARLQWPP
jgi:hypothetical protein